MTAIEGEEHRGTWLRYKGYNASWVFSRAVYGSRWHRTRIFVDGCGKVVGVESESAWSPVAMEHFVGRRAKLSCRRAIYATVELAAGP